MHAFLSYLFFLELVSCLFTLNSFYIFTHVYIVTLNPKFSDAFPAKSIFCNGGKIMGPGGICKIITFLSHFSHVIGKTNKRSTNVR